MEGQEPGGRRRLLVAAALLALVLGLWRACRAAVPRGAEWYPFLAASLPLGESRSPGGDYRLLLFYNDAGAAHSGKHWTWIVADDWLTGKRVVAAGYGHLDELRRDRERVVRWVSPHVFEVVVCTRRYGEGQQTLRVDLRRQGRWARPVRPE